MPAGAATPRARRLRRRISAAPGRNTSTSPSSPSATSLRSAARHLALERPLRRAGARAILDRHLEAPPLGAQRRTRRGSRRPARRRASPTSPPASGPAVARCSRRSSASATSPCRCRSWNSSSSTAPTPAAPGSDSRRRVRIALGDEAHARARRHGVLEAHAVADRSPTRSPSSSATRRAARRAASRRGSSTRISPSTPASSSARGTRVVLPAPGGASSTSARRPLQRRDDVGKQRIDGQRHEGRAARRATRKLLLLRTRLCDLLPTLLLRRLQLATASAAACWRRCRGAVPGASSTWANLLAHFPSVSAPPLQAPRVAALQTHRAGPLMRRRHRRAALRAQGPRPPPSPAPPRLALARARSPPNDSTCSSRLPSR